MLSEQRKPILWRLFGNLVVWLQQTIVRRQYRTVDVGSAARLVPILRPHKHDQALLSCIHHVREGLLQHRIAFFNRQQREYIAVGRKPLIKPEKSAMGQQQANDRCPEPCQQSAPIQNKAASSAVIAPAPVWIAEKTIWVRSPLASLMTMFLT